MQKAEEKPVETNKINVKIERKNDIFYLYNMETDEFLTQGSSKEEIQSNLKQRYGNVNMAFHATPDNIKEVGFK
jgi:stalled ribosome rescue protein Dom34